MAYAFAEELARSGLGPKSIMLTFQTPEYRGPYGVYLALGNERVLDIANECGAAFEACRAARQANGNAHTA